jgi:hypothetical protein
VGRFEREEMGLLANLRLSFWIGALGAVVVYVFFVVLATVPLQQVAGMTAFAGVLAGMFAVRSFRINNELADPGGDPRVRRALNHQRERRGF